MLRSPWPGAFALSDRLAILVEDNDEARLYAREVLEANNFTVSAFPDQLACEAFLASRDVATDPIIDLFVLDRRIPVTHDEFDSDEAGDALFASVRATHPDARVIVFTGYSDWEHVQAAYEAGGDTELRPGETFKLVSVLRKLDTLEFEEQVQRYAGALQRLADIELDGELLRPLDRRILRRVGLHYGATRVSYRAMGGGYSGARVWSCALETVQAGTLAVVLKVTNSAPTPGGLQGMLPPGSVIATIDRLRGLMGSKHVAVQQLAGVTPNSLFRVLGESPSEAAAVIEIVARNMAMVAEHRVTLTLEAVCNCLIEWDTLDEGLGQFAVPIPPRTLFVSASVGLRHLDLHLENVLVNAGTPVLIDLDSSGEGPSEADPVTVLLCTLIHRESPLRAEAWPTVSEIFESYGEPTFGQGTSYSEWFAAVMTWVRERQTSPREFWAVTLAYCARQLKYEDVRENSEITERLVALATKASQALTAS